MSRLRPRDVALVLVAVGFVGLSLTVALVTPPWEANDEPDHVRNTETLRDGDMYRITRDGGIETHQPPLYYLALAGYANLLGLPPNPAESVFLDPIVELDESGIFDHEVPQDAGDSSYVRRLRLPSVALGLVTVLLVAGTASLVSADAWTPVVGAATAAFIPKFVFVSGVINNDNLANLLGALAVFLAVALLARPSWASTRTQELGLSVVLGVTVGAMILTKSSTLFLLPGIALTLVLVARREPGSTRRLAVIGMATAGTAALVCGWWLGLSTHWYGDPVASSAARDHFAEAAPYLVIDPISPQWLLVNMPKDVWRSFWYSSGWNQFRWSIWWTLPFWILLAGGLAGLTRGGRGRAPDGVVPVLVVLALGGPAAVVALAVQVHSSEGRVAFVSLAAIATLYALGVERLRLPVWARFALPAIGLVGTVVALHDDVFVIYR